MKRESVGVAAGILAAMLIGGCAKGPAEPGRFASAKDGFSIAFPPDWERQEGLMGSAVNARSPAEGEADPFRENVTVVVERIPPGMALATYVDLNLANLQKVLAEGEAVEAADATIGGHPARRIVYTLAIGKLRVRNAVYLLVSGGRGYAVTCSALPETFDRYEERFAEVVGTLRLK